MSKTRKIRNAVADIVDYLQCPLFISDKKYDHDDSREYLESMPNAYKQIAYKWIHRKMEEYNTPIEGMNGASASDMDDLMMGQ